MAADGTVKSADRVAELLELLGTHRAGLRMIEIAQELGIAKSSAHGLLQTLTAKEFIVRDELQRYRIGMKLFALSASALDVLDVRQIAKPTMELLAAREHATCNLAVLDGHDVVYIEKVEDAAAAVHVVTRVGTRLPAHVAALGKVLVAELPDSAREDWLAEHDFVGMTEQTRTSAMTFARDLKAYERDGYAVDIHEFHDAINGFAAGVRDSAGTVIAAISLTCLGMKVSREQRARLGNQVREAADEISANLRIGGNASGKVVVR
ncbi:IclR family transcriptional regulator [Streptomyces purpurogeneiscleroticus]|uniref:IclR family transcriptional regulator n=1 Tax=Streptomyces purpurogeneiscleroticus TaxID=68259 RepID=UPI001CBEEC3A|nr:IclR family transcriptional regulator [Streptomyces purpurogeneiscleroticus]MBZ4017648.1 hypothetical protein [Streptomyces purpurogeneiscleroticus]